MTAMLIGPGISNRRIQSWIELQGIECISCSRGPGYGTLNDPAFIFEKSDIPIVLIQVPMTNKKEVGSVVEMVEELRAITEKQRRPHYPFIGLIINKDQFSYLAGELGLESARTTTELLALLAKGLKAVEETRNGPVLLSSHS